MNLEKQIILKSLLPDIISAILIFTYTFVSTQIDLLSFLNACKLVIVLVLAGQFIIAPVLDHFLYKNISNRVKEFYEKDFSEADNTELLEKLMQYPFICAVYTSTYFILGSIILFLTYYFDKNYNIQHSVSYLTLVECLFGAYFAALYAYTYCNKICSEHAYKIVEKGVNQTYVLKKKFFGLRFKEKIFIYIVIPLIVGTIINILVLIIGFIPDSNGIRPDKIIQISRISFTALLNFAVQLFLGTMFFMSIAKSNSRMKNTLLKMNSDDITQTELLKTDLSDEIAYNYYLTNKMLVLFRDILFKAEAIGKEIKQSSQNLIKVSNDTESTAVEQSTGTSEIVSTMENASKMAQEIEEHINLVADLALKTVNDVSIGSENLKNNINTMEQIEDSNRQTILGIKELNEKIGTIWDVVTIINSIADQTKIIAFNAELEATGVQEAGKNFRNVANEIRRLANSTMDSTNEIKERISEIQSTTESLIKSSQESTAQITNGTEIANKLNTHFTNIKKSSENNANAASEIRTLVKQQSAAFEQIVKTLQQISIGIQSFSISTRTIIETSNTLENSANELENVSLKETSEAKNE